MSARFARGRRTPRPLDPLRTAVLLWEIHRDPRFKACSAIAQAALVALFFQPHGDGRRFWPKHKEWADAIGVSLSSIRRAKAELVKAGILRTEPWLRPDGQEGSSICVLDGVYEWLAGENQDVRPRAPLFPHRHPKAPEQGCPPASTPVPSPVPEHTAEEQGCPPASTQEPMSGVTPTTNCKRAVTGEVLGTRSPASNAHLGRAKAAPTRTHDSTDHPGARSGRADTKEALP